MGADHAEAVAAWWSRLCGTRQRLRWFHTWFLLEMRVDRRLEVFSSLLAEREQQPVVVHRGVAFVVRERCRVRVDFDAAVLRLAGVRDSDPVQELTGTTPHHGTVLDTKHPAAVRPVVAQDRQAGLQVVDEFGLHIEAQELVHSLRFRDSDAVLFRSPDCGSSFRDSRRLWRPRRAFETHTGHRSRVTCHRWHCAARRSPVWPSS